MLLLWLVVSAVVGCVVAIAVVDVDAAFAAVVVVVVAVVAVVAVAIYDVVAISWLRAIFAMAAV